MSATIAELSPFERRLTLRFEGKPLDNAETRAARRLSYDLDINGFRRGRAPRRMVENIVGRDRIRSEALEELISQGLPGALGDAGLAPAVSPSVDEIRDVGAGVEVDVRVSLWPTLDDPPEYRGRRFELDGGAYEVTDELVQSYSDRHRDQFAELETVERDAVEGDFVAIDIHTSLDGKPLDNLGAADLLHEIGSLSMLDGLDDNVVGCSSGDIVEFATPLRFEVGELDAGTEIDVRVLVKEVKEKRLPELDDDWVSSFTEFDTVEDLRDSIVRQLEDSRLAALRADFHNKVMAELVGEVEVEVEVPQAVIEAETVDMFERFRQRLEQNNLDFDDYLESRRQDREGFFEQLRSEASKRIRTRILLDSVANEAGIEVEDQDLRQAYQEAASGLEETVEDLSHRLSGSVQELSLMGDILRTKALAALIKGAVAVDPDGTVLDLRLDPPEGTETVEAEIEEVETVEAQIVEAEIVEAEIVQGDQ